MRGHLSGSQLQVCTQVRRVLATFTCEPAELQRTTKSSGQLPVYERHSPPGASFSSSAPISLSMDYPPLDIKANHWLPARESSLFWIQASTSSSDHLADLPILTGCGNVPVLTHEKIAVFLKPVLSITSLNLIRRIEAPLL